MKTASFPVFASLIVLLFASAPLVPAAEVKPAEKLYVTIDYFDPIRFRDMRYSPRNGEEVILSTLKATAAKQAQAAGYSGEVIVLDENVSAPAAAPVLRLTWGDDGSVMADLTQNGRNRYLGVVSRTPLMYHPDRDEMRRRLDHALMPDDHRDLALRVHTEMDLFVALQYVVKYQQRSTKN